MQANELTLGQIVLVEHKNKYGERLYRHYGEVMSRPFDVYSEPLNHTTAQVMVRLVPNDPNTLAQLPTAQLSPTDSKLRYVQYAVVAGMGQFPIDMLRYDFAAPANFILSEDNLGRTIVTPKPYTPNDSLGLVVGRAVERKSLQWTVARWNSFGWNIKPLNTLPLKPNG